MCVCLRTASPTRMVAEKVGINFSCPVDSPRNLSCVFKGTLGRRASFRRLGACVLQGIGPVKEWTLEPEFLVLKFSGLHLQDLPNIVCSLGIHVQDRKCNTVGCLTRVSSEMDDTAGLG